MLATETRNKLQDSLVLVHGGMAQDVGTDFGDGDGEVLAPL